MNLCYDTFATPLGAFSAACDSTGALLATAFGDRAALQKRLPAALRADAPEPSSGTPRPGAAIRLVRTPEALRPIQDQILAYFAGDRFHFDLPLAARGTDFQRAVWAALSRIPFGQTRSYGQLARELRRDGAARAVGRANALNPICLIVPCHRVIGADGSLTGFAFGEAIKQQLLAHERSHVSRSQPQLAG